MIKRMTILSFFYAALLVFAGHVRAAGGSFEVVVPAKAPSRPARFNWTFKSDSGKEAQTGQFACGSYWVAPAEGDTGVTFVSLKGSPNSNTPDMLTCDADPVVEKHGLLNGKNKYGSHDPAENVLPTLQQTYKPAANSCVSLVAAVQRDEAATSPGGTKAILGEVADAYCVVTVLPKAPKNAGKDMIRPNITGATKDFLTWDDFDLSRLPSHNFLKGRNAEGWESARIRWAHSIEIFGMSAEIATPKSGKQFAKFSEGGRAFRAALLIDDYASGMALVFNGDVMALFSTEGTLDEKKPALAAMIAFGLDLYHARYDIGTTARKQWSCGAGQSLGQFLPPVLAAALLKDPAKANQLRLAAVTNHGEDPGEVGPHELRQIKRGVTGVILWGDYHPIIRKDKKMVEADWRYWADFTASKCYDSYAGSAKPNPNTGKKTAADPYGFIDGPANKPGSAYMGVALGPIKSFAAAMILMPEIRSIVNTDAPIEYVDRVTRHGLWTWPDPVACPPKEEQDTARTWFSIEGAPTWGKAWGVRPDDVRFAVEDGKGRFKSIHGGKIRAGYETGIVRSEWEKIIALYDGPKFEENAVGLDTTVAPDILFSGGEKPNAYLFCTTPDATIHYTLDGSAPTTQSPAYEKPVPLNGHKEVKAFAESKGKKNSAVRSKTLR